MTTTDPRWPCLVGVGQQTWHRADHPGHFGASAPEPLLMWEEVARAAADDSGVGARLLEELDALEIVYCQTWQYDDAPARLADRLGATPKRRYYSGIGGTTPQVLVQDKEAPGVWVMVHSEEDASPCAKVLLASLNAVGIEARGVEVTALASGTFDLLVGMP